MNQADEDEESSDDDTDFTESLKEVEKSKSAVEDKTGDLNTLHQSTADFERLLVVI